MSTKDSLIALKNAASSITVNENLSGLQWMKKVFTTDGTQAAFLSESKLALDTDGKEVTGIDYSPDQYHEPQTSFDQSGAWLSSNDINYIVLPELFGTPLNGTAPRHGGIALGCLATVLYGTAFGHAIFADEGPPTDYGEGSIRIQGILGNPCIENGAVVDCGIDNDVWILIYIGSNIGATPCTQAQIDAAAQPLWEAFTGLSAGPTP